MRSERDTSRQVEVEMGVTLLAAEHAGRPSIVGRIEELRGAWLAHTARREERSVREAKLLREVERVDRAAARLALETERLRRLKEEAMDTVRRVEPGLVGSPAPSPPPRSLSEEDLLGLAPGLREVHARLVGDPAPRLTQLLAR